MVMLNLVDIPTPGKLLELLFWGYLTLATALSCIGAIFVLSGATPIHFNGQEVTGLAGVLVVLIQIPFTTLILTISNWLVLVGGLKIYTTIATLRGSSVSK